VICDRCGVEVTLSKVRRERMGHIELSVPVVHIWFFKTLPSPMGNLVNLTLRDLERVIYYSSYVVIEPGKQDVDQYQLLDEDEYLNLRAKAREDGDTGFRADIGAPAVRTLLERIDIKKLADELRSSIAGETSQHRKKQTLKRLKIVDAFLSSGENGEIPNNPAWMVLDVVPVLPPDLRPLVPLDGGRFATSDLNDLYRRVINRNNRLQKLIQHKAPEVILRNEKRMLQEAVDALFDNGRRSKAIRGRGKRPLKSLSDMLKGKQGRFRQNLLGKRVDYSGRSVIVVGPELRLHQCGLPKTMAVELFKPFIINKLVEKGIAETVKRAKKIVEREGPEGLRDPGRDHPGPSGAAQPRPDAASPGHPGLRAQAGRGQGHPDPSAGLRGIQRGLRRRPDGGARAALVRVAARGPGADGVEQQHPQALGRRPIAEPSQDMVLGCYFLTKLPPGYEEQLRKGGAKLEETREKLWKDAPYFGSLAELEMALLHTRVTHQTAIRFWFVPPRESADPRPRWIRSTVGRVLFNNILPRKLVAELGFRDELMRKKALSELVLQSYRRAGLRETVEFLDRLKRFGFDFATLGGVSIGVEDSEIPPEKPQLLDEAQKRVERFQRAYNTGQITFGERYNKVIDAWTHANNDVAEAMIGSMRTSRGGFNRCT
jgi:DNA-directed RNA polymerase subunit beta'